MKKTTKKDLTFVVKIILAVILLSCLLPLPYGAFELIRFAAFIGFALGNEIGFIKGVNHIFEYTPEEQ